MCLRFHRKNMSTLSPCLRFRRFYVFVLATFSPHPLCILHNIVRQSHHRANPNFDIFNFATGLSDVANTCHKTPNIYGRGRNRKIFSLKDKQETHSELI